MLVSLFRWYLNMMNLTNRNILITGAPGGIGTQISKQLNAAGANLALHDLSAEALQSLQQSLPETGNKIETVALDLCGKNAASELIHLAQQQLGKLDMVINLAGIQTFKALDDLSPEQIDLQIALNLTIPIQINQAAARLFVAQGGGTIVNIGSTFGSIGFAQFSVYSAAKFGLRGFSEAFRRELQDTPVDVIYIAPRATKTSMNSGAMYDMAEKTKMNIDTPEQVAGYIIQAIQKRKANTFIGFPEKLFCKINALFPGLVDKALAGQNRIASGYAKTNGIKTQ